MCNDGVAGGQSAAHAGRERAFAGAHAIGNTAALSLYAASYVARKSGNRMIGICLSTAGAGVMMASAFLGGHLSFRKGIGVNHTAFEYPVEDWTPVLADDELGEGEAKLVNAAGNDVMVRSEERRVGKEWSSGGSP